MTTAWTGKGRLLTLVLHKHFRLTEAYVCLG